MGRKKRVSIIQDDLISAKIVNLVMDKLISGNSKTISIYDKFEDPLYLAIDISDLDLVSLAIKKGFSLNEEALVLALEIGNIEIVDFLIKNGVNLDSDLGKKAIQFINSKFKDLFTAIRFSWLYNAKDLIESGLDINSFFCDSSYNDNEEYKCTPLIFASSKGEREIVEILLENGADVNAQDSNGMTALIRVSDNSYGLAELLLKNGADINIRDMTGETALMKFSKTGNTTRVWALLNRGGSIHKDNYDLSLILALKGRHKDVVKLLVESGADIHNSEAKKLILETISEESELGFLIRILKLEDYKQDNREMLEKLKIDDDLLDAVTKMTLPWSDNLKNIEMIVEEKRREI